MEQQVVHTGFLINSIAFQLTETNSTQLHLL